LQKNLIPEGVALASPWPVPNLNFTAFVLGQGRIRFRFNRLRKPDVTPLFLEHGVSRPDTKGISLLKGSFYQKGVGGTAAASIYKPDDVHPILFVGFAAASLRTGRTRYYRLEIPLSRIDGGRTLAHMRRLPSSALLHLSCISLSPHLRPITSAAVNYQDTPVVFPKTAIQTAGAKRIVALGIDADSAWYNIHTSNSHAVISSYLNEAEAIYESQLSIMFSVVRQTVHTFTSFNSNQAHTKLFAYQDFTLAKPYFKSSDVHHLFTGDNLQNGVIGISYVGVVCKDPTNSFGLTQYTTSLITPITFVHELAHNFNASHDETRPPTIMYPAITNPPPRVFSDFSRSEILDFVRQYGNSCLDYESIPTPTPTPSPTSTPVPDNPNGGQSSGGQPPVDISLISNIKSEGVLELTIMLKEAHPACKIIVRGGLENKISPSMQNFAAFYGTYAVRSLTAKLKNRPYPPAPLYLMARIVCPNGAVGSSSLKRLNTARLTNVKRTVTLQKWLLTLKKSLRRAAKI